MKKIQYVLSFIVTFALGVFFIWSAVVKLNAIDIYEITLVKQGLASWNLSRFIARLFLALEMLLGVLLVFQYRLKKIVLPVTIGFVLFLTFFLVGRLLLVGNEDDCGCFGEALKFSTIESIIKNVSIIVLTYILWKNKNAINFQKWNYKVTLVLVYTIALISIVIYDPPINIYEEFSIDNFNKGDVFPDIAHLPEDALKGKSIIALFSPTCGHCKNAALKLQVMEQKGTKYKIYPLFGFGKDKIEDFILEVNLESPYYFIDKRDFLRLTQGVFPQIYIIEEGKITSILNKRKFLEKDFE